MSKQKNFLYLILVVNLLFGHFFVVNAQLQTFDFSANNPDSYQCFDKNSTNPLPLDVQPDPDEFGNYYCLGNGGEKIIAQLRPPTLQQIEVWFVRILYAIWGLVASLSFLFLVKLGYEYLISRGDPTKITEVRKKIVSYIIGFALVFLAVPILTTVFRLLGVNTNAQCYNVSMPGFQFFFATLCTDPKGVIAAKFASDPCTAFREGNEPEGITCGATPYVGQTRTCGVVGLLSVSLTCKEQDGDMTPTWCRTTTFFGACSSSCNPSEC